MTLVVFLFIIKQAIKLSTPFSGREGPFPATFFLGEDSGAKEWKTMFYDDLAVGKAGE